MPLTPLKEVAMQQVQTPYELDDVALLNLLSPPDPTQPGETTTAEHLTREEAEELFKLAEAEIQPILRNLRRWRRKDLLYGLAEFFCFCIFLFSIGGIVWQCITYPHTLVILYTKAISTATTATLDLPTRTLAPVTITRSAKTATTGTGHQDATRASGTLTIYNAAFTAQTIPAGTIYTGQSGKAVATDSSVTVPPNTPPNDGVATVSATATLAGASGNMQAGDIALTTATLQIKNSQFYGGQDARTFRAVAAKDIAAVTATVNGTITQALTTAFPLRPGEAAIPTNCTTKATPDHQAGAEAQTVTLTIAKTCTAVAYDQSQLTRTATAAFMETRPGAIYHIVGSVQTTVQSLSPLTVTLSGKWAFTFSQDYQDFLAEHIQGDTPEKARSYLLKTGVISYAQIPNTLASADYINFFVLVG